MRLSRAAVRPSLAPAPCVTSGNLQIFANTTRRADGQNGAHGNQRVKLGIQRASVGGGVRYNADKPAGGPDWGVRLIFTLLFPK